MKSKNHDETIFDFTISDPSPHRNRDIDFNTNEFLSILSAPFPY